MKRAIPIDPAADDKLLPAMLLQLETNLEDQATLAALSDYLQDLPPVEPIFAGRGLRWRMPNWLRLVCLRKTDAGIGRAAFGCQEGFGGTSALVVFDRWRKKFDNELDHPGYGVIANKDVFVSDPYQTLKYVQGQASFVRSFLGIVAVGLPLGTWWRSTARLMMFCPSVLPPPRQRKRQ